MLDPPISFESFRPFCILVCFSSSIDSSATLADWQHRHGLHKPVSIPRRSAAVLPPIHARPALDALALALRPFGRLQQLPACMSSLLQIAQANQMPPSCPATCSPARSVPPLSVLARHPPPYLSITIAAVTDKVLSRMPTKPSPRPTPSSSTASTTRNKASITSSSISIRTQRFRLGLQVPRRLLHNSATNSPLPPPSSQR